MNPRVQSVTPRDDYVLEIIFTKGEVGLYDCRPLLGYGVFAELKDISHFRQARAANGTVVWPDEQDICPDTLFMDSQKTRLAKSAWLQGTDTNTGSMDRDAAGTRGPTVRTGVTAGGLASSGRGRGLPMGAGTPRMKTGAVDAGQVQ
jgi:hypothetical protein